MSFFKGKNILVTGATGLVGSHLVNKLMSIGDVGVIALSRSEHKLKSNFEKYFQNPLFNYIVQDVALPLELDVGPIDVIFNTASPISGNIIANTPVDVIKSNIFGTINCLNLLHNQRIKNGLRGRLVLFSSVTVYGNIFDKDTIVYERDTNIAPELCNHNSSYAETKRMIEVIAQAYITQYNVDVVIARPSYIYGSTINKSETALFSFLDKIFSNENILINKHNLAKRDNIYIDDVISGLLLLCEKGETGQAYNISSNGELGNFSAIDEIAELMINVANKEFGFSSKLIRQLEGKGMRTPGLIVDNSKLKSLGWNVNVSQIEGIRRILSEHNYFVPECK